MALGTIQTFDVGNFVEKIARACDFLIAVDRILFFTCHILRIGATTTNAVLDTPFRFSIIALKAETLYPIFNLNL